MSRLIAYVVACFLLTSCGYTMVLPDEKGLPLPVAVAANYLDKTENANRKELRKFLRVDPVTTEWCAAFVNAALKETGREGSDAVAENPLAARSFLKWGRPVDTPKIGDVVVFERGNNPAYGHVGFFIEQATVKGIEYYVILGGNQNDKVSLKLYRVSKVVSIRRGDK